MKKILMLLCLLIPISANAANLYTNDFTGTEPPDNWSIAYTERPSEMSAVTFTASAGVGYMGITTTTGSGDKVVYWDYDNGSGWSNYSVEFTLEDDWDDLNTWWHWGVYYPGSGTFDQCRYVNVLGFFWRLYCKGQTTDGIRFYKDDVIKVWKYGSDIRIFHNDVQVLQATDATTEQGTIYFGLERKLTGYSNFNISNLTVDEVTPFPTATSTISPTNTHSPTISPTPTQTPYVTPTNTPIPYWPVRISTIDLPDQPQDVCEYDDRIWVTINDENGRVCEVNPSTFAIDNTIVLGASGANPLSIYGAFGYVWTGNQGGSNISRIDVDTYAVINTALTYSNPLMMVDDGTSLYVAATQMGGSKDVVAKINPSALTAVDIELGGTGGNPFGICIADDKMFVSRFIKQDMVVVDYANNTPLARFDFTNGPSHIVYAGGSVWVTSWGDGVLWKVNPDTYSVANIALDYSAVGSWVIYTIATNGNYVYTNDYEVGRLHKVHMPSGNDIGWADSSWNPQGMAYYDNYLYVADALNHKLIKIYVGDDSYSPFSVVRDRKQDLGSWKSWIKKNLGWGLGGK